MKSGIRRYRSTLSMALVALLLAAFFQNCISKSTNSDSIDNPSTSTLQSGNGSGYDGKLYVHLLEQGICPDNTLVDSQIEIRDQKAFLTRQNCTNIPITAQIEVTVTYVATEPGTLVYDGKKFIALLITILDKAVDSSGNSHVVGFASPLEQNTNGTIMSRYMAYKFIAKIDNQARTINSLSASNFFFKSIKALPDGNFLVFGNYKHLEPDSELMLMKLTPAHQIIWQKHYGQQMGYLGSINAQDVAFDDAGNIYLALWTLLKDGRQESTIAKLASNGDLIWQRSIKGEEVDAPTYRFTVPDRLLIRGSQLFVAGYLNGMATISRLNTVDGASDWTRNFPQFTFYINRSAPITLSLTEAGTPLLTAGPAWGKSRMIQFGETGEILSAQYFTTQTGDLEIRGLTNLGAGLYNAAGTLVNVSPEFSRGALVRFSLQGVQWASQFRRGNQSGFSVAPSVDSEGGILLFGHTDLGIPPASRYVTASVVRYNSSGAATDCPHCSTITASLVDDNSLQVEAGPPFSEVDNFVERDPKPISFGSIPVPLFLY